MKGIVGSIRERIDLYRFTRKRYPVIKKSYASLILRDIFHGLKCRMAEQIIEDRWDSEIISYLEQYYSKSRFVDKTNNESILINNSIWVLWYQGESEMPPIIRKCYESILRNCNGHPVILLTRSNLSDYVMFPQYILEKVDSGQITLTHFSDIIRLALLKKYGGLWLDSSIYVSDPIPDDIFKHAFWSIKGDLYKYGNRGSQYRWTAFCMASHHENSLVSETADVLYNYWEKETSFIHYFIIDYSMSLVYNKNKEVAKMVDDVQVSNTHVHSLQLNADRPYCEVDWTKIHSDTFFHKLSYKLVFSDSNNSLLNQVLKS